VKPTEILSSEHRVIEQVLNCLEAMVRQARSTGHLDRQSARALWRLPQLRRPLPSRQGGGPPLSGDRGQRLPARRRADRRHAYEHEQGRARVRGMDENIEPAAAGDAAALGRFIEHAEGYLTLLREHIYKEDHILFQLADRAFSEEDQQRLLAAFQQVEAEEMGAARTRSFCTSPKNYPHAMASLRHRLLRPAGISTVAADIRRWWVEEVAWAGKKRNPARLRETNRRVRPMPAARTSGWRRRSFGGTARPRRPGCPTPGR